MTGGRPFLHKYAHLIDGLVVQKTEKHEAVELVNKDVSGHPKMSAGFS
jgi:hypothetical protein